MEEQNCADRSKLQEKFSTGLVYRVGEQCDHSLRGSREDGIKSIGRKPHWG